MSDENPEKTTVTLDVAHFSHFVAKNYRNDAAAAAKTVDEFRRELHDDCVTQFVLEGIDLAHAADNVDQATREKLEENNK